MFAANFLDLFKTLETLLASSNGHPLEIFCCLALSGIPFFALR